jgi:hypothetical protein
MAIRNSDARQDFGENPGFSNHNSAPLAMRLRIEIMRHSAYSAASRRLSIFGLKTAVFHLSVLLDSARRAWCHADLSAADGDSATAPDASAADLTFLPVPQRDHRRNVKSKAALES